MISYFVKNIQLTEMDCTTGIDYKSHLQKYTAVTIIHVYIYVFSMTSFIWIDLFIMRFKFSFWIRKKWIWNMECPIQYIVSKCIEYFLIVFLFTIEVDTAGTGIFWRKCINSYTSFFILTKVTTETQHQRCFYRVFKWILIFIWHSQVQSQDIF